MEGGRLKLKICERFKVRQRADQNKSFYTINTDFVQNNILNQKRFGGGGGAGAKREYQNWGSHAH